MYSRSIWQPATPNRSPASGNDAKTGEVLRETGAREQDMTGPIDAKRQLVLQMILLYRPNLRRWVWGIMANPFDPLTNYRERVLALLDKSPIKP